MMNLIPLSEVSCETAFSIQGDREFYTLVKYLGEFQLVLLEKVDGKFFATMECSNCNLSFDDLVKVVGSVTI